ncbi:unnamed protein product, partial [Symbiodinium sp. KB8]
MAKGVEPSSPVQTGQGEGQGPWRSLRTLLLGQVITFFITGTGICSSYLAQAGVHIPTTQSTLNYVMLATHLVWWWRSRSRHSLQ